MGGPNPPAPRLRCALCAAVLGLGPAFLFFGFVNLLKEHYGLRGHGRSGQAAPHPQPRSSEGSAAPAAAAAGGDDSPKGTGQADVLLHRLHYALPGWDAAAERRDAQDELHSAAQARAWADGDFDANHGLAFDGACVGRPAHQSRTRGLRSSLAPGAAMRRAVRCSEAAPW
jgi:hypothetical protein